MLRSLLRNRSRNVLVFKSCGPLWAFYHKGDLQHWRQIAPGPALHIVQSKYNNAIEWNIHEDHYCPYQHPMKHLCVDFLAHVKQMLWGMLDNKMLGMLRWVRSRDENIGRETR